MTVGRLLLEELGGSKNGLKKRVNEVLKANQSRARRI